MTERLRKWASQIKHPGLCGTLRGALLVMAVSAVSAAMVTAISAAVSAILGAIPW